MAKGNGKISGIVRGIISETVENLGYSIWDIEYKKIGADWHLTVTIDKENGVDINDCEIVHHAIDPLLDEADPIEEQYYLNVSSPGVERDIRTAEHFILCRGEKVCVKTFSAVDGKKTFEGILGCNDDASIITIDSGKKQYTFQFAQIAKANIFFEL